MPKPLILYWIGPVLSDSHLSSSDAASPAANRWQLLLIKSLAEQGVKLNVFSHLPESAWPRGRLWTDYGCAGLPDGLSGKFAAYLNLPLIRHLHLGFQFSRHLDYLRKNNPHPAIVLTYNAPPAAAYAAKKIRKKYKVPWVCIVADGGAPGDADGYIFLSWWALQSFDLHKPKLYFEGGIKECVFKKTIKDFTPDKKQILMYTGTFSEFGGAPDLINAFRLVNVEACELWLTGKGHHLEIEKLAKQDKRVKILGFQSDEKLENLMRQADIFVNPRPARIHENKFNFPSKVLEYLSFGRPIISTWTAGLSPEYRDILSIPKEQTIESMATAIQEVIGWSAAQRQSNLDKVCDFARTRTWAQQAERLKTWLAQLT